MRKKKEEKESGEKSPKSKSILISQPEPFGEKSPYKELSKKYGVHISYKPFIVVEGIPSKEFRKSKLVLTDFSAIIFNSRNSIDHFFRICEELRVKMSQETKYFCASETIALYLQKYIQYRKRKVFYGDGSMDDFKATLNKHKILERFLLPCSAKGLGVMPEFLTKGGFKFEEAIIYKTVSCTFSKKDLSHDVFTFFNPEGVRTFVQGNPDFKIKNKIIAAFGDATVKTLEGYKLPVHIKAPQGEIKSMSMAIEKFLKDGVLHEPVVTDNKEKELIQTSSIPSPINTKTMKTEENKTTSSSASTSTSKTAAKKPAAKKPAAKKAAPAKKAVAKKPAAKKAAPAKKAVAKKPAAKKAAPAKKAVAKKPAAKKAAPAKKAVAKKPVAKKAAPAKKAVAKKPVAKKAAPAKKAVAKKPAAKKAAPAKKAVAKKPVAKKAAPAKKAVAKKPVAKKAAPAKKK